MALSLMLRNSSKLRGLPSLTRYNLQHGKVQNFSIFLNQNGPKTLCLTDKCKMQFINDTSMQTKRNMSSDHSKMWTIEKIVSLMLLGVVPATFICPNNVLDNLFALCAVIHFHWGLEAVVIDYVRPIIVGNLLPKVSLLLLYIISATTLGGLLYFNHTQIGIGQAARKFWCITGCPEDNEEKEESE